MEQLFSNRMEAPFGTLYLAATPKGICRISFSPDDFDPGLFDHVDAVEAGEREYHLLKHLKVELRKYFSGHLQQFTSPLDVRGTVFQNKVWQAMQAIPYGKTETYAQVAATIRVGKGFRAVGTACGANPLPIVIPCHRVVGSHGGFGGYAGGLPVKEWLLRREGVMLV